MRRSPLRKTPFKRSNMPLNKVSKRNTSKRIRAADARAREALKNAPCVVCGNPGDHLHHLLTKAAHPELRQEPRNHCKLCVGCHDYAHSHPEIFRQTIEDLIPGIWDELARLSLQLSKGFKKEAA